MPGSLSGLIEVHECDSQPNYYVCLPWNGSQGEAEWSGVGDPDLHCQEFLSGGNAGPADLACAAEVDSHNVVD